MIVPKKVDSQPQWFVMRDLKRPNAKLPAYRLLASEGIEVFTPLTRRLNANREWEERPLIHGLLFAHGTREGLNPAVARIPTLQYRYLPKKRQEPMTVPHADMDRFIRAVESSGSPRYYLPEEVTPEMLGRRVRVFGGPLDGYEGFLLKARGSKRRRLLVELPDFFSVGVDVSPDYVQVLD